MSEKTIISLGGVVPGAQALAESIANNPTLQGLNKTVWLFSLVEITHLLSLVILGGATLVLALRTLGVSLVDAPATDVERLTRPWLHAGVIGGVLTGIFMSIETALTLVGNGAFLVKILALAAAVLFSLALARRLHGGRAAVQATLALIGLGLLVVGLCLFAGTKILAPGATLLGAATALFLLPVAIARLRARPAEHRDRFAQLLATGTVVAWLTVTISGRWIGFS